MKRGADRRRTAKRLFDVVVAALVLVVTSPLLLLIAAAVRLSGRGPVVFRQDRVGLGGGVFRMHKFRSMRVGQEGPLVSAAGDARVTRVGRVLRKSKFDELPQLLDVLAGHMSVVGPRPEVPRYVEQWSAAARDVILSVRPGITDPASVELRDEDVLLATADDPERYYVDVLLPRKTALYVRYVESQSLGGDLRILVRTVRAVLRPGHPAATT